MSENKTADSSEVQEAIQSYRLIAAQCDEAVRKARKIQDEAWERVGKALRHVRHTETLQQSPT